jgi:hypothetical protein
MLAPICLFTYNRPVEIRKTIEGLQRNFLASSSELFIFSDGSKNESDISKIKEVRNYIKLIKGFKSVEIINSNVNKGLANSVIDGVTKIIETYGKVIVLEDDLIVSPNFLNFLNQSLDFYYTNNRIFSISGYTMNLPSLTTYQKDYYLGYRASSWGWGTWIDRWQDVDWKVLDYNSFKWNPIKQLKFMRGGSDMPLMLHKQMKGQIDSWAIRWCYHQFRQNQFTIFPSKSKVMSIGFGENATHTKKTKRFITSLDSSDQNIFQFDQKPVIDVHVERDFKAKFSFSQRILNKITGN